MKKSLTKIQDLQFPYKLIAGTRLLTKLQDEEETVMTDVVLNSTQTIFRTDKTSFTTLHTRQFFYLIEK